MARRSFLFLLFVLCFGLSVPALAVQGEGGGNNDGNGQGGGSPTTSTTTAATTTTAVTTTSNGNGDGEDGGPPTTTATTTGNGDSSDQSTTTPPRTVTTVADPVATNDDTGRVATFLAASQIPVETDSGSALPPTSEGQSAPERMISWLLAGNEQRFLPIVASPFVALMVVGRALTSAGSGAIAPIVLLGAVGFTKLLDRRRANRSPSSRKSVR